MMKRKRIIPVMISFLIFYFSTVLLPRDYNKYYNLGINCGIVIKVIENSEYKTQPSIIVNSNGKKIEIIQYENFDYNFKMIEVNDKICKKPNSSDFIRIKKNGEIEVIKARYYNDFIAWLLWKPNRNIKIEELKSDCKCLH